MMDYYVLPWVRETIGNYYIFTGDIAPVHASNISQKWCKWYFDDF